MCAVNFVKLIFHNDAHGKYVFDIVFGKALLSSLLFASNTWNIMLLH
jgi:hypothetical protein